MATWSPAVRGTTCELLKDEVVCEPQRTVAIKGNGTMETKYIVGRRDAIPA